MKKIYLSMLGLTAFAVMIIGQTSLSSKSNSFKEGDSHDFNIMTAGEEGQAGENAIWDFTNLKSAGKTLTSHMLNTSASDKSAQVPEANLILEEYGNHFFFKVNNDGMEQYGVSTGNSLTKFDKPCVKLKFPFKYGDKVAGNYSGSVSSSGSSANISGTYEVVADAYGSLLLPNNITIENAIRVKQTRTFANSDQKEISYRWYASGVRYPILTVIKYVSPQQSFTSQTALYAHTSQTKSGNVVNSLEDLNSSVSVEMFPNPYTDQLRINYKLEKESNVSIQVYDITGKLVKTLLSLENQEKGIQNYTLNSSENGFMPGAYYVRLTIDNNSITRKVVQLK
jgi:hypothetical protein